MKYQILAFSCILAVANALVVRAEVKTIPIAEGPVSTGLV